MSFPVSFFIGLRYSRSQSRTGFVSFITFFSIAGIFLGVASLITVVSVMNGFEGDLKKRILGLVPHIVVDIAEQQDTREHNSWQNLRAQLIAHEQVRAVTPFIESEALIQSNSEIKGVLMQGILPELEGNNIVSTHMISGQVANLNSIPYSVIIGQALAHQLDVQVGSTIRLVLPGKTVFTPMGRLPMQRTFTVAGIFNVGSQIDSSVVYIHSKSAAKLMRKKGDGINQLRLYLDNAFDAEVVAKQLNLASNTKVTLWKESQGALFSAVKMEKNMMWLMLSLIIAVAAFNIVSALVMVVMDKKAEIGILQTLGLSREGIIKIFISQGLVNGIWGVVLGTITGVVLTLNLNNILSALGINVLGGAYNQQLPIELLASDVVAIIVGAIAMTFAATLYPAYRASHTQPAEVLRNE